MLACCGFVTNYCCSALGTVSSKFTSIMNLENLDTRKLKALKSPPVNTQDVSCGCHVLSSHLKEAEYKCGYVLISFVSLQCADLPKVQNFLVVGDNVFEAPLIVKQCDFSFLHPHISSQEGVKDTTNGNLHQKLHNKML